MAGETRLQLIAEFQNRASSGVNQLKRDLGGIRETPGMNAAQRWMRGFQVDAEKIQRNAAGVGSIMGSMGLGGVAAAGGIAAAVGALKKLGDRTIDLQAISRETGIAMTQLKILQNAARDLHVNPQEVTKGVQYLTGQLALARRGFGDLYGLLNQVAPEFMRKIMAEDPAKAMDDVLARLARIPQDYVAAGRSLADGIQAQKQWTAKLLGDEGLGRLVEQGPEALAKAMQHAAAHTAPVTKGMVDAAKAMDQSINDFNDSLDKLETKAAPALFRGLEHAVKDFSEAFDQVETAATWLMKAKDHPAEAAKELGGMAVDAAKEKAGEIAGRWSDPHFDDKRDGKGLFAPAKDDADRASRLAAMQAELDAVKGRVAADKNPVGFPVREADNLARMRELRDAIQALRDGTADFVRKGPNGEALPRPNPVPQPMPQPAPRPNLVPRVERQAAPDARESGLLQLNAYHKGGEGGGRREGLFGGLSPNTVMLYRDLIASGTKSGFLGAFHELQGEKPAEGGGSGGGVTLASYGGSGASGDGGTGGGGAGSARYRAAGGGSFVDSGGTTRAGGTLAANQREAYKAAIGEGLSKTAARALVADLSGEGLANDAHRVHWDGKHNSGGIAQWDPPRAEAIRRQFGKLPWELSIPEQTKAAIWEYRNNPRFAKTKRAMEGDDPHEMMRQLVENYEAPKFPGPAISRRMGYFRGFDPDAAPTAQAGTMGARIADMKRNGLLSDEQCVTLAMGAVGIPKGAAGGGNVHDWRKGVGAAEGTLQPGTPVATFLNRDGSQSDRYAGGGAGTPGAHLDHAGRFQRYVLDEAGKRIGMVLAEQYKGSHGVHEREYMFGKGWGEGNGSNYHAILGPDGQPLGHGNNPLARMRKDMEAHAVKTASGTAKRVLHWFKKGSNADDPSDTPISTNDMRDMRFAPPGWKPDAERHRPRPAIKPLEDAAPRKSLLEAANHAGMGGAVKVEHSGGATVEIRGLPEHRGVKVKTHGMIADVSVRRGRLTPQTG